RDQVRGRGAPLPGVLEGQPEARLGDVLVRRRKRVPRRISRGRDSRPGAAHDLPWFHLGGGLRRRFRERDQAWPRRLRVPQGGWVGVRRRVGGRPEARPWSPPLRRRFVLQRAVSPRAEARDRLHGLGGRVSVPGEVGCQHEARRRDPFARGWQHFQGSFQSGQEDRSGDRYRPGWQLLRRRVGGRPSAGHEGQVYAAHGT
ncbi:unnamed protein product, partial [Ectocarpus sp. 12 AP-2014]